MENSLRLLGVPVRETAGGRYELPPGQATHLAAVLALRGEWFARDELVALLWPDAEPRAGRHNLAQLVYAMRRAPWGTDIEADPQRLRWSVATDVASFRGAAAVGAWGDAAERYRGDLLDGVREAASARLGEWLRSEREDLRETWRVALLRRAEELAGASEWFECSRLLRRLLASDGLLEEAVYGLIRAEALVGRRDSALRVYEEFRARLRDELALEPLETTTELAAAVRAGALPSNVAGRGAGDPSAVVRGGSTAGEGSTVGEEPGLAIAPEAQDVRTGPVRGLGADSSPFVGRSLELAELHGLFRRGTHRLVTLLGPGGTGKTRLARQLARERAGHHEGGGVWVPLAAAMNEADAVEAIARAMGLKVEPDASALATALEARDLLIVLDQVEHLPDVAGLAQTMLDTAAGLQLVATSRSPLDLPEEAVMLVGGLAVPSRDDADDAEAYDAVGLLLRAGRRTRPDLHPRGPERTALVALARLLDGSPLGLELAAGWLRFLEPSELLDEVRRDLDVLDSRETDADPAHASLRAVFESSWSLLQDGEREALRRLAVFRGGCTRESAVAVADVPLATLLALTNRSLLRREGNTRFAMHPVVQHFADGKLAERPEAAAELLPRHAAYFLALADDADRRLDTPEQPTALARLTEEGPNITAALERALAGERSDEAYALVASLGRFWRWRGRAHEGLSWTARVRSVAAGGGPTAASVRARLGEGLLLEKVGRYDEADEAFQDAQRNAERLGDEVLVTSARLDRSIVAWRRGDLTEARRLLESVCETYRRLGREALLAGALGNLGNVARDAGDLDAAHACFDEALELVERIGHVWEIANVRNNKAIAFAYARDMDAAGKEFERALEMQRSIDNRPGMAMSLTNLGNVNLDTDRLERAAELYHEALELCEEIGDADGVAHLNVNLGILAQWSGDFDTAHGRYADALTRRRELGARGLVAQSVLTFLDLAVARGSHERALVLAGAVRNLIDRVGVPLPAPQQSVRDEAVEKARAHVPAHRADDLERRGEALSEPEAIDFALGTRALP